MDSLRSMLSIVPSGTAATIIVGHALLTKLMMTGMFRLKLTMKSTPKAECTKILKSQFYQRVRSGAEPTFAVDAAPARRREHATHWLIVHRCGQRSSTRPSTRLS